MTIVPPVIARRTLIGWSLALIAAPAWAAQTSVPRVRRLAAGLDRIVAPETQVEVIATGMTWAEGPTWAPGLGLLFSDPPANLVRRWTRDGGATAFLAPSGAVGLDPGLVREAGANGLAIDPHGRLLIANSGGRSLDRFDLRTRRRTMLVDRYRGRRFNSPNDLHVARDGSIWFTDPPDGLVDGDRSVLKEQPVNGVYRWRAGREAVLIDGALTRPNGIALSPDERRLYVSVSDEQAPRIVAYDLDARGQVRAWNVFLDAAPMHAAGLAGLPDGMKIARDGTLFCTVPGGCMVMTPDAEPLGLIEWNAPIANCAFGEGGRTLFLTGSDRVFRLPLAPGFRA